MNNPVTASAGVYELLLFAYPRRFRLEYGAEMASVFAENCSRTYEASGLFALGALWLAIIQDLMVSASAEHVALFLSISKRDLHLVARAPAFAAASGALVGTLFFIAAVHVRITHNQAPAEMIQQFHPLAIATVSIAVVWLASVFAQHVVRYVSNAKFDGIPFVTRLQAFKRLAKISLILAFASVFKYAVFDAWGSLTTSCWLPPSHQWLAFPLILLVTVASVFLLEPVLSLRPLSSHDRKPVGGRATA